MRAARRARTGPGARRRRDERRAGWARSRTHGATWGLPVRVARGQRASVVGIMERPRVHKLLPLAIHSVNTDFRTDQIEEGPMERVVKPKHGRLRMLHATSSFTGVGKEPASAATISPQQSLH